MWRKVVTLSLLTLPCAVSAYAADWSIDAGYYRREYSIEDQLGATSPSKNLKLVSGQGPSLHASVGWHTKYFQFGVQTQAAYLFLNGQPKQEYVVKGTHVDTAKLTSPLVTMDAVLGFRTDKLSLAVAIGPAVQAVSPRWGAPFDYDVVSHVGIKTAFPYSGMDVCLEVDLFVVPTVVAKNAFAVSPAVNITFGKADEPRITPIAPASAPTIVTAAPHETVIALPKEETPAALPNAPTPAEQLPDPVTQTISKEELHKKAAVKPHKRADEDTAVNFIAKVLKSNQKLDVQIKVGTEFSGKLRQRAEEIKKQLLAQGINGNRIRLSFNTGNKVESKDVKFTFVLSR
jgi:hypothetical protein